MDDDGCGRCWDIPLDTSETTKALAECQGETMNSSPEAASKDQNPECMD